MFLESINRARTSVDSWISNAVKTAIYAGDFSSFSTSHVLAAFVSLIRPMLMMRPLSYDALRSVLIQRRAFAGLQDLLGAA